MWLALAAVNVTVYKAFHPDLSWSVMFIPQTIAVAIACLVLEPHKEKAANISGGVLLLNLKAIAAITAILDVYTYSEAMAWVVIAVMMLPHCVIYTFGTIRGIRWLKKRAVVMHRGIGSPFFVNRESEGNPLLP